MRSSPALRRPVLTVCRIRGSNVWALSGNLSDLTAASSRYDILLCSETLVSDMRRVHGVAGSRIWSHYLVVRGQDASCP